MSLAVRAVGGFHVGGRRVRVEGLPTIRRRMAVGGAEREIDQNDDFLAGQAYVQYVRLERPGQPWPLLLWHGGGMTGVTWEDTPDARPGWQMRFLEAGYDVYVADTVERGRAGWARFPEIYESEPVFRGMREAWELFRIGPPGTYASDPAGRRPYPGQRFPWTHWDQFARQTVPRWVGHEAMTMTAYLEMIRTIGQCAIVSHSQSGAFAMMAAAELPDLVRAVVAVEPSGAPGTDLASRAAAVPHLAVWGDYFAEDDYWSANRQRVGTYWQALADSGARAETLDLPARGITGNSHFPMMDDNSDDVAARVVAWLSDVH